MQSVDLKTKKFGLNMDMHGKESTHWMDQLKSTERDYVPTPKETETYTQSHLQSHSHSHSQNLSKNNKNH